MEQEVVAETVEENSSVPENNMEIKQPEYEVIEQKPAAEPQGEIAPPPAPKKMQDC